MKNLKLLFSFVMSIILSFLFIGCSKNENYNSISFVGESMFPTIGTNQTIYYKTSKKYTNNNIVIISNIDNKYIKNSSSVAIIKRIIATPNQTIKFYFIEEIENNCIYDIVVYDKNNKEIEIFKNDWVPEKKIAKDDIQLNTYSYYQTIFKNIINNELPAEERTYSFTLSEDEYFVMGDNYNISYDSRYFGPINKKDILGKVNLNHK